MSLARGRINMARPIMLRRQITGLVAEEVRKGGAADLAPCPVRIEPPYCPLRSAEEVQGVGHQPPWIPEPAPFGGDLLRSRVWVSREQNVSWHLAESFPRQLQGVRHRVCFEIVGNVETVTLWLACHREDACSLRTAFEATFNCCKLQCDADDPFSQIPADCWSTACFYELHASSVYSKRLTQPDQLSITPLAAVFRAMQDIPTTAFGLYQIVFQPVARDHNWHCNIGALYDFEFFARFMNNAYPMLRTNPQFPSADERVLADALNTKAHNDKHMFAVAPRLALLSAGRDGAALLQALGVFSGLLQHGGRPLQECTETDYRSFTTDRIQEMFRLGLTYRPGFLANSAELTSLVHMPPPSLLDRHAQAFTTLNLLTETSDLSEGSYLGDCHDAGTVRAVRIPSEDRPLSVHMVGKPGKGKTETLKNIIMDDILRGDGVVVIDPHADLIDDLVELIPEEHVDRTILLDWSDPEWIPIFNPLAGVRPCDRGTLADNFVKALKDLSDGWGHRAQHLLRSLVHGILHLPEVSLLDVSDALTTKDDTGKMLRDRVLEIVEDPVLKRFWRVELGGYTNSERAPVVHKLGLLLDIPPVSRTFMQTRCAVNLGTAIDNKNIVLVNLAGLGQDIQSTLGSLILSLLQVEMLTRSRQPKAERQRFHIHIDEAHQFTTNALERLLMQCRKYEIGVCLCHQYLRQYSAEQIDALANVGSTVIFNVDIADARRLCNGLRDKVTPTDIIGMKRYEAIARIDTEIVRIKTRQVVVPERAGNRQRIIELSHSRYYERAPAVLESINRRNRRWDQSFTPLTTAAGRVKEPATEYTYDEY